MRAMQGAEISLVGREDVKAIHRGARHIYEKQVSLSEPFLK